jgi:glyoxylase-like metal-dependent hydrolase (beta-lactamase superfamily II)
MRSPSPSGSDPDSDSDPAADFDQDAPDAGLESAADWAPETAAELDLALAGEADFTVDPLAEARRLAAFDVLRLRAENPGPLTLSGTNTWVVDRDPAYVIDPGPALRQHLERVVAAVDARGGLGGIALTHDHTDHIESVNALRNLRPAPLAAARGSGIDVTLTDGVRFGPLTAVPTPGHAPDHYALVADRVCFTGDAVLGEGSAFIAPYPGALNAYLNGLVHLCTLDLEVLCPGHGPAVWEPVAKLQECVGHRYDREHGLLMALAEGSRTVEELLDKAWRDVPADLRPAAAITLAAHLDKLEEEGSLPAGVERPRWGEAVWEDDSWAELSGENPTE